MPVTAVTDIDCYLVDTLVTVARQAVFSTVYRWVEVPVTLRIAYVTNVLGVEAHSSGL